MAKASTSGAGPDIAIVGAARSGTSLLASQLSAHPNIDPGSVKEPNFFSRRRDNDAAWYESLYADRSPDLLRLDGSVSYTYPKFPDALQLLAKASPDVFVIYVVRDPIPRAVSHYLFYRHYFHNEAATDFGAALQTSSFYADVSDYERWLDLLRATFTEERVLVVPFPALRDPDFEVTSVIWKELGISQVPGLSSEGSAHQNNVVEFRHPVVRKLARALRQSRWYPQVRARLGADRMRRLRSVVTRKPDLPTNNEVLASCDPEQLARLTELEQRARDAVGSWLRTQDTRLGLAWAEHWEFGEQ